MDNKIDIVKIYCEIDDFYKDFKNFFDKRLIANNKKRISRCRLSPSEVMTIVVYFHLSGYRTFKHYYLGYVSNVLKSYFPDLVSYNRFVELIKTILVPLYVYLKSELCGDVTGLSFIDSTSIKVCHNRRINSHRVFSGLARRGKNSIGWFYGFKLHLIINDVGEIISFKITPGNVDDRNIRVIDYLTKDLLGKLFGDKGYLSKKLEAYLYDRNIMLYTKVRKGMKQKRNYNSFDRAILKKRSIIESVFKEQKLFCQIEHTRHRSKWNFLVNIISGLVAYSYLPHKPSINIESSL